MEEELKYTTTRKSIRVHLENESGGTTTYLIRELTGKQRDKFYSGLVGKVKFDNKGKPCGIKTFDGLHTSLLSLSLVVEETGKTVPDATIEGWPSTLISALFEKAQELSGLDSKDEKKKDEDKTGETEEGNGETEAR